MRIYLLGLFVLSLLVCLSSADSLYDEADPILELYTDTFNASVYGTKKAHFVEFYSSWCGACIAYAPTFKKFARHLATWAPVVQVTAVNCADDKNLPLCREHSINSFPTLKYYKYMAGGKDDATLYTGAKHDLPQMELDVAAFVEADWQAQKPQEFPSFAPIDNGVSLDDLWSSSDSVQFIGLAFQENPATMAWANVINFHHDRNIRVLLARPQHPEAVRHFAENANNRFVMYKKGVPTPVWTSPEDVKWTDVQEKVNELISELGGSNGNPPPERVEPVLRESQGVAPTGSENDLSQYQVQLVDIQSTIRYMLYKEIPRREHIEGEDLASLKQWIHTLKKYAPGTTPMRRMFYRLDEWLQLKTTVSADEWTSKLDEILLDLGNPLPTEIHWMACAGSKSNLRGYTCGLWTLAHAITVEAYKAEQNSSTFSPVVDVLDPFRQFITKFLSCSECAQNFQKEAEKHQLHLVTRTEDMVSWLWRVHNFVNKRLSGSPSEDPKFPKRQFPPKALCPHCYDASGNLDEAKTLEFVKSYYSDIRQDTVKPAPGYKVNEYKDGKLNSVGARHLNPKFALHADKIDKLEAAEARNRKGLDASPQRQWRDLDSQDGLPTSSGSRTHFYFIWLSVVGIALIFAYCKYKRNRSKFWKTFYYHNDFKL